ncbi:MAG: DNA-directed RNA polymerase subunit beta [Endomicrobium sp.]|nr:DNA-directed RNA polymerase subunit beta [Endomicrobium sp.]
MRELIKARNFARIPDILDLPDLVDMQKMSYKGFLQMDIKPENRKLNGLQASFLDVFPVTNADETLVLDFVKYILDEPKCSPKEAIQKDLTYTVSLKAVMRLTTKDIAGNVKQITEQEVFLCDLPMMTENATFIFNGAERVIVSQMHRSPGVIFENDDERSISSIGKKLFYARIIPYRGVWVEFEYDLNNLLFVRIDKKRKVLVTTFLRMLGFESNEAILKLFYENEKKIVSKDIINSYLAEDVVDKNTGEIIFEAGTLIISERLEILKLKDIKNVSIIKLDREINDITILYTLMKDSIKTEKEAIFDIYKKLRSQEFISAEQAKNYIYGMIFDNIKKYDLTKVGRYKINKKFGTIFDELEKICGLKKPKEERTLVIADIVATIKYIINLNNGVAGETDDIDHLGNRRIRAVGELLENQMRIGLSHMSRLVREKMNMQDRDKLTIRSLVNSAPLVGIVRKFFGTSQLSQFMDQINPLAELTHKRRLSALGPGGLNRKRAGFEVRDVHYTHYGRVCPVETPEGANIGLIISLSCYAKVNEYGLIETPYRKIKDQKITDEIVYLTADEEDFFSVAQANSEFDKNGNFVSDLVACRYSDDFPLLPPSKIGYMDISPKQVFSPSTALIPFLEHDDANRALMGANMQRQAVPLMITQKPVVATGIEKAVARDSGSTIIANSDGVVISIEAGRIIIWNEEKKDIDIYELRKYDRSNQDTCINQLPLIKLWDKVKKGDVLADGASTQDGQLALGKNLMVAFMPWEGYNFEDAILLNERLVKDDVLTSIHITEFQVEARELKIGNEEITRDIPNVGEDALRNIDENGIIRIGAEVEPGDILVGKIAPKGEQLTTPEERLLKAIFGKKAEDVQDASLRVTPGVIGKVLDVKILEKKMKLSKKEEAKIVKNIEDKYNLIFDSFNKEKAEKLKEYKNAKKDEFYLDMVKKFYDFKVKEIKKEKELEIERLKKDDELPITVNKVVKVFIATRRKISVGDKMAGRHGNKGIVAKILRQEDMPYLPDGRPVDIVLSPLSIPSRMNVGQVMETILGWAGMNLNTQMVTPIFDGATEKDILDNIEEAKKYLKEKKNYKDSYLPDQYCKTVLYNGKTGIPFNEKITVGYMYMLKLAHLVDDKIHARSTGPYSLITRQPLGGKAQFGGQRLGEMEVWAIEGYGASHTLQEFLTVKSDDINGRTKMYESIIKGEVLSDTGTPESFKVLIKELQSLGLKIELLKEKN